MRKISVITPSYNQGRFIRDTVESVLRQDYPSFEHIVMDGGSTDGTLSVLLEYPHLTVVSEPDRGQTHALNKALALASGEIIAWLNSDDVYGPGAFEEVNRLVSLGHDIVLGRAEETDGDLVPTRVVSNFPRSHGDILRYWVPDAWLAQPSVFFTKRALDAVRYPNGEFLDESLHFVMDTDLWFRLSSRFPFEAHSDHVLSLYRMYDANKTGAFPEAAQRELSRVFRRHELSWGRCELPFTVAIAGGEGLEAIQSTYRALVEQDLLDFEVLIIIPKGEERVASELRAQVYRWDQEKYVTKVRLEWSRRPGIVGAWNHALECASSPHVGLLVAGDEVPPDYVRTSLNLMRNDHVGALYVREPGTERNLAGLFEEKSRGLMFDAFMEVPNLEPRLVLRRIAFVDTPPLRFPRFTYGSVLDVMTRLNYKGWLVFMDAPFRLTKCRTITDRRENLKAPLLAHIITSLRDMQAHDPTFATRVQHNLATEIPQPLIQEAERLLSVVSQDLRGYFEDSGASPGR